MKVGSEPKVREQQPVEEPKEAKETQESKGPDQPEAPKDTFEEAKPKDGPEIKPPNMSDGIAACDAQNAGKPAPLPKVDIEDPDIQRDLQGTPEGRKLLDEYRALKEKGVKVEPRDFCGNAAGQWSPDTKTITIDPKAYTSKDGYYQLLAHEMTHASQTYQTDPARDGVNRNMSEFNDAEGWADHAMEMEARAEARAYDVARDRGFPRSFTQELRDLYDAKMNEGTGTPEERREAAVAEVTAAMKDGRAGPEWARERQTYVDDYNRWRSQQAASATGS